MDNIEITTADTNTLSAIRDSLGVSPATQYITLDEDFSKSDTTFTTIPNFGYIIPSKTWVKFSGTLIIGATDISGGSPQSLKGRVRVVAPALPPSPTLYGQHNFISYNLDYERYYLCASSETLLNSHVLLENPQEFGDRFYLPINFTFYGPSAAIKQVTIQIAQVDEDPDSAVTIYAGSYLAIDLIRTL
jgi:hypothetical protein